MSDIDRTRMIPLHIADQAVAACDAEIAKLREENARLKAEVDGLEARINYVDNLANRYALDDVRSQAQVERLTKAGDAMDAYLKRQDGTTNGMLDCRLQWLVAKEGKPHA
jgi:multidrug resistance efflux pump